MPARRAPRLFIVKESFFADQYGLVTKGERFHEDHPVIRKYPQHFEPGDTNMRGVEQATAAPGEQRGAPA